MVVHKFLFLSVSFYIGHLKALLEKLAQIKKREKISKYKTLNDKKVIPKKKRDFRNRFTSPFGKRIDSE